MKYVLALYRVKIVDNFILIKTKKSEVFRFIVRATTKVISRSRFHGFTWWDEDLNLGPPGYRSCALTLRYIPAQKCSNF